MRRLNNYVPAHRLHRGHVLTQSLTHKASTHHHFSSHRSVGSSQATTVEFKGYVPTMWSLMHCITGGVARSQCGAGEANA